MNTYAIIGAGTMGSGIAQKIAMEGGQVILIDLHQEALQRGKNLMEHIFQESISRKILSPEQVSTIYKAITFTTQWQDLQNADFIIEAAFEDQQVKADIFAKLENIVKKEAIIASNTSSFPITQLSQTLQYPERFIGLHFFYHPVKNRLLEIIPGAKTSPQAIESAQRCCSLLGKVDILCKDSPGFVVNRFFVPWLNESVRILAEGKASIAEIEATAKIAFKLGMGPFQLMNVTGVPIAVHAADGLAHYLGDFYRPHPLLIEQAQQGLWEVPQELPQTVNNYVFNRLLGTIVSIAATLISEQCATPLDIDLGARVGLRWPTGPLFMFNQLTPAERVQVIQTFAEAYPAYPVPGFLTPSTSFSLPGVFSTPLHSHSKEADVASVLHLARPDASNAFNQTMFQDLHHAVSQHAHAPLLIIKGKGKNFAAGADIHFFIQQIEENRIDRIVEFTRFAQETLAQIDQFPGTVIAVVDGFALGGGAELMLAADIIVTTPRALIGFPETGIGIYPGLAGTYRLAHRIGLPLARYLVGTGQFINGKEAVDIGLAHYCQAPENITTQWLTSLTPIPPKEISNLPVKWQNIASFMDVSSITQLMEKPCTEDWQIKIREKLKYKAPIALNLAFQLIENVPHSTYQQAVANELAHLPEVFTSQDALIGLKSIGKYKPQFTGK